MKPYYVAPVFYFPMQHAISLINQGYTEEEALKIAIRRFGFFGKKNNKRLKDFDRDQFRRHLHRFVSTPNAILVRKSPKKRSRNHR